MSPPPLSVDHVRQQYQGDCLAACAAMVFDYYDLPFSYKQLISLLRIQPDIGTPAYNIRELTRLGLNVTYEQGTMSDLEHHLTERTPVIAFVRTSELPHWATDTYHAVLVVGLDRTNIFLNDPAFRKAPVTISRGDFELAWLARDEKYAVIVP